MTNTVYLIYDGECPICSYAATMAKIREAAGKLEILNARETHPLVLAIKKQGYNLDKGIVVKDGDKIYYGKDAMNFLALVGTAHNWFNRLSIFLFRSKTLSAVFYPLFKAIRRSLLFILKIPSIRNDNSTPIFQPIFADNWQQLPPVLKKHYANRPYSADIVPLEGSMDIEFSKLTRALAPLFRLFGALSPYEGKNIPTTVYSKSETGTSNYILERHFNFPGRKTYIFRSKLIPLGEDRVIEAMKFGIGWYCQFKYENNRVWLIHKGFRWRVFGLLVPLPLNLFLGRAEAWEEAIDDDNFRMYMAMRHPWFGNYIYKGQFKLVQNG